MKRTNLIYGLILSVIAISCTKSNPSENKISENSKAIKVKTIVAKKPSSTCMFKYSGIVVPKINIPLSFQIPGSVVNIYVDEGDYVKKGQILAELDKTSYESAYMAARAMQKQAQDAYDRLKTVYDKGSLPEIKWEEIKSKVEQANSAALIAKKNLDNSKIIATSDGVIGSRNVEVGSNIIPSYTVFNLIKINDVFVRVSVPENEINKIEKGQIVNVVIPAINQNVYTGKVEKIGVMANPISKTYEIKIRVGNKDMNIRPGMVCNVEVSIQNKEAMIGIPYQAVIQNGDKFNYVYKVNTQTSTVKKQIVEVCELSHNMVQIKSGVSVGDILVVEGQHKLSNNDRVIFN